MVPLSDSLVEPNNQPPPLPVKKRKQSACSFSDTDETALKSVSCSNPSSKSQTPASKQYTCFPDPTACINNTDSFSSVPPSFSVQQHSTASPKALYIQTSSASHTSAPLPLPRLSAKALPPEPRTASTSSSSPQHPLPITPENELTKQKDYNSDSDRDSDSDSESDKEDYDFLATHASHANGPGSSPFNAIRSVDSMLSTTNPISNNDNDTIPPPDILTPSVGSSGLEAAVSGASNVPSVSGDTNNNAEQAEEVLYEEKYLSGSFRKFLSLRKDDDDDAKVYSET